MSGCFCMGPQNGQPLCPCRMRDVEVRDGRWVRVEDLGPVTTPLTVEEPKAYTTEPKDAFFPYRKEVK